jgi:peptidoglycan/LPS O-acetylase OafA/YrhL
VVLGHVPALDGVRGVAVLLVVCCHLIVGFYPASVYTVLPGGFMGVDIFFVLSGFLITSLLLTEQRKSNGISLLAFYRRRALRLLPALVGLLIAHFVYTFVVGDPIGLELKSIAVVLLYVENWWAVTGHPVTAGLQHLWSLSIEEQFYAVWPLVTLAIFTVRRSARFVTCGLGAAVLLVMLWRAHVWVDGTNYYAVGKFQFRTDLRADSLLVGALAAHLWIRQRVPRRGLSVAASCSTLFIALCLLRLRPQSGFLFKGGFTLFAVAVAVVIVAVVDGGWFGTRLCAWLPLRAVGRVSYGLYLWHLPVMFAVARYTTGWPALERATLALVISAVCTIASWYLVEVPFLRRKSTMQRAVSISD